MTVKRADRHADVEILWEGGARTQLRLAIGHRLPGRRTGVETVALVRRLAERPVTTAPTAAGRARGLCPSRSRNRAAANISRGGRMSR